MCKFSSKSGGVPFQPLGDLTWNDPIGIKTSNISPLFTSKFQHGQYRTLKVEYYPFWHLRKHCVI